MHGLAHCWVAAPIPGNPPFTGSHRLIRAIPRLLRTQGGTRTHMLVRGQIKSLLHQPIVRLGQDREQSPRAAHPGLLSLTGPRPILTGHPPGGTCRCGSHATQRFSLVRVVLSAPGGSRTPNLLILSQTPLPVGLLGHVRKMEDSNPRVFRPTA